MHLSNWKALLGLHRQGGPQSLHTETRQVDRIIFNKIYNRRTKDGDIAMMHLETPVNFTGVPAVYSIWHKYSFVFVKPLCVMGS